MKYAVLGSAGQLGHDLCHRLPGDVCALTRAHADLTDFDTLRRVLTNSRPDVVINCAAYNSVDRAESEPLVAFAVNAWGVRDLAIICRDLDCTLVHFSSDYVFGLDPHRRDPFTESDAPGPVSVYGLSKLAGEYLVRSTCPKHFIIRTCGLYGVGGSGGKGGNFVETMLRLARGGQPLRVVADQVCTPSFTLDVASASLNLLATEKYGLYHLTNAGYCSWYEFALTILALAGVTAEVTPIASHEYAAAARRPRYSVLARPASEALGLPALRPWSEALRAYLQEKRS
jgi:dTDP-4-dehydrorhamnose reductase